MKWEAYDGVPADAGAVVDRGLGDFNASAAPTREIKRVSCFARGESGEVIGGAVGRTWGECCELQQLWVAEAHRRQGIGRRLLALFEDHAAKRGCRTFYLETFSFQAPDFYRRAGYHVLGEIRGFPGGMVKYLMARILPR